MVVTGTWSDDKFTEMCDNSQHRKRHRSYCFTINNPSFKELVSMLNNIDAKYWCFGFETGSKTGTDHIQGYVQYNNPKDFSVAKSQISNRAHLEPARGTPIQNRTYCSKEGDFYEFGDIATPGPKTKTWDEIELAMKDPKANIGTYAHYHKSYQMVIQDEIKNRKTDTKFYSITPVADVINEVHDYFGQIDDLVIIFSMEDLAKYPPDPKYVLLLEDTGIAPNVRELNMYPRGMPITYKYGYEHRHIKPDVFIIETHNKGLFPLYKNI